MHRTNVLCESCGGWRPAPYDCSYMSGHMHDCLLRVASACLPVQVTTPFLLMHGAADIVTDPEGRDNAHAICEPGRMILVYL
jgi:hypothetical protein